MFVVVFNSEKNVDIRETHKKAKYCPNKHKCQTHKKEFFN